jgi:hypothetical protein
MVEKVKEKRGIYFIMIGKVGEREEGKWTEIMVQNGRQGVREMF